MLVASQLQAFSVASPTAMSSALLKTFEMDKAAMLQLLPFTGQPCPAGQGETKE